MIVRDLLAEAARSDSMHKTRVHFSLSIRLSTVTRIHLINYQPLLCFFLLRIISDSSSRWVYRGGYHVRHLPSDQTYPAAPPLINSQMGPPTPPGGVEPSICVLKHNRDSFHLPYRSSDYRILTSCLPKSSFEVAPAWSWTSPCPCSLPAKTVMRLRMSHSTL
jgi:hypothetical protein